jgi:ornithine cyclodeaminase
MPKVLILSHAQVDELLPMDSCIGLMAEALVELAKGRAVQPLRTIFRPEAAAGLLALMPAYRGGRRPAIGLKAIGIFPGNVEKGKDAHQGSLMLFDGETGELRALMNAAAVTAIRTAAVSAVATRVLAREDAGDLAILGSNVQARTHLRALALVRPLRRVRVASVRPERARAFAKEAAAPCPVEAVGSNEAAVRGADLVVTATSSPVPVLHRDWIGAGAHLNAIGASLPDRREIDTATVAASRLFVDRRESAVNEAGDYLIPLRERAIGEDHIRAELGDVLTGAAPGRQSPSDITLFKSLGLAVEDLWAADHVFRRAQETRIGSWVEF